MVKKENDKKKKPTFEEYRIFAMMKEESRQFR